MKTMQLSRTILTLFVAGLACSAVAHSGCREPTYVMVDITTDVPCDQLEGTTITLGRVGAIEDRAPVTSVTTCSPDGKIGSLVVTPSAGEDDEFAVRVVSGVNKNVDECKSPGYGQGCIVARRALKFIGHEPLTLPIAMRASCNGKACSTDETCVKGTCVDARIDSSKCTGSGCSEDLLSGGTPNPATDGGTDGGGVVTVEGCGGKKIDFVPSNIDVTKIAFPAPSKASIETTTCDIVPRNKWFSCLSSQTDTFTYQVVPTEAGDVAVFGVCDLTIQAAARLRTTENLPIVIVALGSVEIFGTWIAGSETSGAVGGGAVSVANTQGGGLGGGSFVASGGSGGGGYCGEGGMGVKLGGASGVGGKPYGDPTLVPLRAGSAGAASGDGYGGGGGAVQIIAGARILIAAGARLYASGGYGYQFGGGGGSGGAILLEAPEVRVDGVLAANGGGGGSNTAAVGQAGQPSDQPALGSNAGTMQAGGSGSAGTNINGAPGTDTVNDSSGAGGGGGAGRIRINARTTPTVTGTISPATSTPCATFGNLK